MSPPTPGALGEYLAGRYASAAKIVEVGIGRRSEAAHVLRARLPRARIVVTDVDPDCVREARSLGLEGVVDDVMAPRAEVYAGADLVYAVCPPLELVPSIARVAQDARADLLVVPTTDEADGFDTNSWLRVWHEGRLLGWARSQVLSVVTPR